MPYAKWPSLTIAIALVACSDVPSAAKAPTDRPSFAWGPETPSFNVELLLRPPGGGGVQGFVKFRQPNDDALVVELGVMVRGLAPNTHYQLQRAVDAFDGTCTSTSWLTLGKGLVPQDIVTDDDGNATENLFRTLSMEGAQFDIRQRIVLAGTTTVVLVSNCHEFTVSR
jgi:hypothetical protein